MRTIQIRQSETMMAGVLFQRVRVRVADDKGNKTYAEFQNTNIMLDQYLVENDRLVRDANGDYVITGQAEQWNGTLHHVSPSRRYVTWECHTENDLYDKVEKWAKTCALHKTHRADCSDAWLYATI